MSAKDHGKLETLGFAEDPRVDGIPGMMRTVRFVVQDCNLGMVDMLPVFLVSDVGIGTEHQIEQTYSRYTLEGDNWHFYGCHN